MNKVILCGNLTKDNDVRYTQSGKATARMPIAINGCDEILAADFFNLVAWAEEVLA